MADEKLVGKVTHYYDKIMVMIVKLKDTLKVGDSVHITGKGCDFVHEVTSMEDDHKKVEEAKKGVEIGVKVDQPVKENCEVYKVE